MRDIDGAISFLVVRVGAPFVDDIFAVDLCDAHQGTNLNRHA
jgi:hypothetical protein